MWWSRVGYCSASRPRSQCRHPPRAAAHWLLQRLAADLRNEEGLFSVEYDRYPITNDVVPGAIPRMMQLLLHADHGWLSLA